MKKLILILSLSIIPLSWAEEIFLECEGRCWVEGCEESGQGSEFIPFDPGKKISIAVNTAKQTISLNKEVKYEGTKILKANYLMSNWITEGQSGKRIYRDLVLNRSNGIFEIQDWSRMVSNPDEGVALAIYRYQCKKIEPLF